MGHFLSFIDEFQNGSVPHIITFLVCFLVVGFLLSYIIEKILKNRKNRIATEQKKIFDRYKQLERGMTREEVMHLFEGLKPSVKKRDRLEYKYDFRTTFTKEEGKKIVIFFENQMLVDIKIYDTNTEWYRY